MSNNNKGCPNDPQASVTFSHAITQKNSLQHMHIIVISDNFYVTSHFGHKSTESSQNQSRLY